MFPDVVILAGGLGKRLQSITGGSQKVLAKIGDRPFLEILIDYIASQGGRRFILCVGHGSGDVAAYFKNKYQDREIIFSVEDSPLGTGGAIKQGSQHVKTDRFLAMNGDCFCVIDYLRLIAFHQRQGARATLAVTLMPDARDYGTIEVTSSGTIEAFKEKQPAAAAAFINTGTYCFDRDVFSLVATPSKFSIEYDFFPHLVGKGFYAFEVENRFVDIGTPERYSWAQEHLETLRSRGESYG
ncbi:MAG: nucleotidyltransferase family protein [Candidatus Omnitrophica bacterium]|nr:nucleotidyltransferase family protein [Candidatus Omnitrophota bacterium]MDE2214707.1 nucleotidyltransferase family protein [Candidatus Omnitrophota bacterium]